MMNVQTILERIERDAKDAANTLLAEAIEKARAVEAEADQAIEQAREETLRQAVAQAAALSRRMRSIADLDARKDALREKRLLLDEAFSLALDRMNAMPEKEARAHGLKVLLATASGTETVVANSRSTWCDATFIREANEALRQASKPGQLTLSGETRESPSGGFTLKSGGMEINCTYRAMLETAAPDLEAAVAALLFA